MKKNLLFTVLFSLVTLKIVAIDFVSYDLVYKPGIKSVRFAIPGLFTSAPIIRLSGGTLELEFDELSTDSRYLRYIIQYCNRDWSPTELQEMEFLQGFNDEEIRDISFSINTKISYVHYKLTIPNQDVRWILSGNYLIHVYDEDTQEPILTRRFAVVEELTKVPATLKRPSDVSKINTHHEVAFSVRNPEFSIPNPRRDVRAIVLQNYRWDNAITNLEPFMELPKELDFNYIDRIVFPAGKEFRSVDIRSLRFPGKNVLEVSQNTNGYEVKLDPDESRAWMPTSTEPDVNGWFVIKTNDRPDTETEADYAYILFTLKSSQELFDYNIYLTGGFTDWQLLPEYKMEYHDRYSAYFTEATLKQGVYDYIYVAVPLKGGNPDFELLEGNWHETENFYTILIYYRPFGQRYDRIIGMTTISQK